MITGNVFFGAVLGIVMGSFGFSCKGAERNTINNKDTSILARSEQSFTIEAGKPFYQLKLISTGKKLSGDKKLLLILDAPSVMQNPDGVYEIYLSANTDDVKKLSPSHPAFINVLDLYALTVSDPPKYLSVDLTKKIAALVKDGQPFPSVIVTIIFRGNVLPGNVESKQAGKMNVKGMRVVQEN